MRHELMMETGFNNIAPFGDWKLLDVARTSGMSGMN